MKRAGPENARAGLVLAHGRGADAADILGLWQAARLPDVAALAPEALGRSWWPTSFLAPSAQIEPFVTRGVAAMEEAVGRFEAEGIPRSRIWLAGFSQGAGLALETFARKGEGLAGVLAFSGGLIGTGDAGTTADLALYGFADKTFAYPGRRDGAKVWISVHERDPHIPLARAQRSSEVLAAMGATVETAVWPGAGHGMLPRDLEVLQGWISA